MPSSGEGFPNCIKTEKENIISRGMITGKAVNDNREGFTDDLTDPEDTIVISRVNWGVRSIGCIDRTQRLL